jgi:hypothetical protein
MQKCSGAPGLRAAAILFYFAGGLKELRAKSEGFLKPLVSIVSAVEEKDFQNFL